jgi:hypothetical protein
VNQYLIVGGVVRGGALYGYEAQQRSADGHRLCSMANLNFTSVGAARKCETIGLDGQLMSLFVIVLVAAGAAVVAGHRQLYNSFDTIDIDRDQLQGCCKR